MESETNKDTPDLTPETVPAAEPAPAVDPPADAHCPNCNEPAIRKGKVIICQACDAGFRYTKEGPKLEEIGPFDDHERRIKALEGDGLAEPSEPQPPEPAGVQPPEPGEPQPAEPARPGRANTDSADDGI